MRRFLFMFFATTLILACNFPLFAPVTQAPGGNEAGGNPAPSDTATATSLPTFTPLPSIPSTPTTIPTPTIPQVTPISVGVYCRSGPDVGYDAVSSIVVGQVAEIVGRNDDRTWWYVRDPNDSSNYCWVSASVVTASGNLSGLAIIPAPAGVVTKVTVNAAVSFSSCGGPNVIEFSGKITTNGPVTVEYQWEVRGDKTNTTSPEELTFSKANTKDVPDPGAYKADCGDYSITLHVLSPNDISAKKNFSVP
jgi:hypothetical protein